MDDNKILVSVHEGVASLVINNPEKHNAFSIEMSLAAADAIERLSTDSSVRVIVISGAGERSFVSGGDISKFEQSRATPEQVADYARKQARFREVLRGVGKPTIARIRGYCLGGGLTIALNCDLRFCSEDAQFGVPAARLGLPYGIDPITQIVRIVGPAVAKDIMFSGRRLDAHEALRVGLVNQVLSAGDLDAHVEKYAAMLVRNAPLTIIASKRIIDEAVKDAGVRNAELCEEAVAKCFASQDYVEGRRAFMEKRRPVFTGQ
jgi:enoyl-CoA hydratase